MIERTWVQNEKNGRNGYKKKREEKFERCKER